MTRKIIDVFTILLLILVVIFGLAALCSCGTEPKQTRDEDDNFKEIEVVTVHVEEIQYENILTEEIITEHILTG